MPLYPLCSIEFWMRAFAPSIPTVITIVAGFYIFHNLALKRQKRQEIFSLIDEIKGEIQEILDIAQKSWAMTGKNATESGNIRNIRRKILLIDIHFNSIIRIDENFRNIKGTYFEFKRSLDEYEDSNGSLVHMADLKRPKDNIDNTNVVTTSTRFGRRLYDVFTDL